MSNKYPYVNPNDTFWDEHHRRSGQMTNNEFFSSNVKGGFYEGMEWDGEEWVPDSETREKEQEYLKNNCDNCGYQKQNCWCES